MKRTIVKIGKTGKRITAFLGFFIATCWGIYAKYSAKDLSGEWRIEFKVEESSFKPYIGETHVQKIFFKQNENNIEMKTILKGREKSGSIMASLYHMNNIEK